MRLEFRRINKGAGIYDLSANEFVCKKCGRPPHPGGMHPIGLKRWCFGHNISIKNDGEAVR